MKNRWHLALRDVPTHCRWYPTGLLLEENTNSIDLCIRYLERKTPKERPTDIPFYSEILVIPGTRSYNWTPVSLSIKLYNEPIRFRYRLTILDGVKKILTGLVFLDVQFPKRSINVYRRVIIFPRYAAGIGCVYYIFHFTNNGRSERF